MHQSRTRDVGLEVHKASMAVAYVAREHGAAGVSLGTSGPRHAAIAQRTRQLPSKATRLVLVSAAGPCGSWRWRSLPKKGSDCWGVAPALLPQNPGDRVTTDRRDAMPLAHRRRSGDLPPVSVPPVAEAALRDLGRARQEALRALQAAPGRRHALWLRHARRSPGPATWCPAHLRGLRAVVCPPPAPPSGFPAEVRAVNDHAARRQRLAQERHAHGPSWRFPPVVAALPAPRAVPRGRPHGGRPRRRDPLRPPQTPHGCLGPDSLGSLAWAAAPAGGEDARRAAPCPTGAGRGRLGLSGPGPRPAALPTTARNTAQSHPGEPLEGPRPPLHARAPAPRPRAQGHPGRGRPGAGPGRLQGG